jgi:DNA-binding CsgD family transcriptional regulator
MRSSREREWLELVADVLAAPLTAFPEQRVAEQLRVTFEARGVAFNYRTPATGSGYRMWPVEEQFDGHRADIDRYSRNEASTAHPVLRFYLATSQVVPLQVHDVPDRFADRRVRGAWVERASQWGCAGNVALPMYFAPDGWRSFVLGRADPFTRDELSLIAVVQRLLVGLDRQSAALRRVAGPADPAQLVEAAGLTPRELTVLGLVAEGLTAAAVARRLALAESTVHKHLHNAYRKLGVRDRLAAVLRAQQLGVVPPAAASEPRVVAPQLHP